MPELQIARSRVQDRITQLGATGSSKLLIDERLELCRPIKHGLLLKSFFLFLIVDLLAFDFFLLFVDQAVVLLVSSGFVDPLLVLQELGLAIVMQLLRALQGVILVGSPVLKAPFLDLSVGLLKATVMLVFVADSFLLCTLAQRVLNHLGSVDAGRSLKVV